MHNLITRHCILTNDNELYMEINNQLKSLEKYSGRNKVDLKFSIIPKEIFFTK